MVLSIKKGNLIWKSLHSWKDIMQLKNSLEFVDHTKKTFEANLPMQIFSRLNIIERIRLQN